MNYLIDAEKIYTQGCIDGAMRYAEMLEEEYASKDRKYAKPRFKSATEVIKSTRTRFALECENLGYSCPHMKLEDSRNIRAFAGFLAVLAFSFFMWGVFG